MSKEPIFAAHNRHVPSCGKPPKITAGPQRFVSYFENELGEQMIFVHENDEPMAVVYSGDCNWELPIRLPAAYPPATAITNIFTAAEAVWIAACLSVMQSRLSFGEMKGDSLD